MALQLLAGMFLGSALASVVWGFVLKTAKSRSEALRRKRDEVMHSIGEIWVEIDSLFSSHKCGVIDDEAFNEAFTAKIKLINHHLKPNMHLFEIFYVKYVEGQIEQYKKIAHYSAMTQPITTGTAADHEIETSYAMVGHHEAQEALDFTVPPESKKIEETDKTAEAVSEKVEQVGIEQTAVENVTEVFPSEEERKEEVEQSAEEQSVEEEAAADEEKKEAVHSEAEPEEVDEEPEVVHAESEEVVQSDAAETDGKDIDAISVESATDENGMFDVVAAEERMQQELESAGTVEQNSVEAPAETVPGSKENAEDILGSGGTVESDLFGEDDFTMETLMDVDINAINPYIEEAAEIEKQEAASEDAGNGIDVVIAEDAVHTEAISEEPQKVDKPVQSVDYDDDIPEETTYTPASELEKRNGPVEESFDEQFADIEDFEVSVVENIEENASVGEQLPVKDAEQEEITFFDSELVTGDDIADSIAALDNQSLPSSPEEEITSDMKSEKTESEEMEKEPVAVTSGKTSSGEKKKDGEESITGDDVVDQIDSFFGLIE